MDLVDIWYDRMRRVAKEAPPAVDPHDIPGLGRIVHPHAQPENKRSNPDATEFSKLHPDEQKRQLQNIHDFSPEGVDLSHEGIVNRLMQTHFKYTKNPLRAKKYHEGGNFYHEANDYVHQKAQEHGLHPRQVAGVVAALSPGTDWDRGIAQVNHLLEHHRDYNDWEHAPSAARHYHATVGPGNSHGVVRNTAGNYTKAFNILRHPGDDNGDYGVDKHLGGHKVRSFFNNIIDPHGRSGRSDVTMDRHAVSAAVGGTLSAGRLNGLFYGYRKHSDPETGEVTEGTARGSSKPHNTVGTYAHFADAYREAHRRLTEMGEDAGATPAHFQAKIWGIWRKDAANNHKKEEGKRKVPHYASNADMGHPLDVWGGIHGEEPDPDIDPEGNEDYWNRVYEGWPRKQASPHGHQSPSINNSPKQGYGLEDEGHDDPEPGGVLSQAVYYPIVGRHHLASNMDEFLFEGVLEEEPEGALPYTEGSDEEDEWNKAYDEAPGEVGTRPIHPSEYISHPDDKTDHDDLAQVMLNSRPHHYLHPSSPMPHMNNLQVEADGGTGMAGNWSMDTNQSYSHGGQTPSPRQNEDGSQYREDQEGNPHPSDWWQRQHSTSAENPASTGPQSFGDTLDPAEYPFAHGQTKPDEQLLAPGESITSMTFGPQWGFDYMASLQPYLPKEADISFDDLRKYHEQTGTKTRALPLPGGLRHLPRHEDEKVDGWDPEFNDDPAIVEPLALDEKRMQHTNSVQQPAWLAPGAEAHEASLEGVGDRIPPRHSNPGNSDIAKAARAHLAALSASEQDELIHEGEKEGVLASNYDLLDLRGTHYAALEEEFQKAEADPEDLFW